MITENNRYPLREIAREVELPFIIRRASYTSDFCCRVDSIDEHYALCTGIKGGKEYSSRKYRYSLNEEVIFISGSRKKAYSSFFETVPSNIRPASSTESDSIESTPTFNDTPFSGFSIFEKLFPSESNYPTVRIAAKKDPPSNSPAKTILHDFFSIPEVMNSSYYDIVTGTLYNSEWIQTLATNYLALIKRKIRIIFGTDNFIINDVSMFYEHFPAYEGVHVNRDDLLLLSTTLNNLFNFSLTSFYYDRTKLEGTILSAVSVHKCRIVLNSRSFIPETEISGELTVFGVFALINTFLDSDERVSLSFDLLNESSGRSHYYLENLFNISSPAINLAKSETQKNEEHEKTILSLYVHRKLSEYYLNSEQNQNDTIIKKYVESALFIGDSPDYSISEIAYSIRHSGLDSDCAQILIEDLFAIGINRKYYNLIKWQKKDNKGSFLKNAERFCKKLLYISDSLFTEQDEATMCNLTEMRSLLPINSEQKAEFKEIISNTGAFPLEKIHIQLYHVSDKINEVMYDDTLLGNRYKWFFTFEQDSDCIVPEPKEGFKFVGWFPKTVKDSPIAKITLFNDYCDRIPVSGSGNGAPTQITSQVITESEGTLHVVFNEQNEQEDEFDEDSARKFYKALESTEKTSEPCRTVLYSSAFEKSVKDLEPELAEKVELVKKKFAYLPDDELKAYLDSKNSKHLRGRKNSDIPFYKFRLSYSARLFFCYGSDINIRGVGYPKGTVILSEVVTDHDAQGKASSTNVSDVFKFSEFCSIETNIEVDKHALLYEASTTLPLLSGEQAECTRVSLPCEIMGSAGSGKSSIAVEMYRRKAAENPDFRILYVANNPALVKHIRECLAQAGITNPICLTFGELSTSEFHSLQMVQKDTFAKYRDSLFGTRFTSVEKDIFSMCFDSGIKGNVRLAETAGRYVSEKVFLDETAKKEHIPDDLAKLIYELAVKYDGYLEKNKIFDNNDLARRLIYKTEDPEFQKYDVILADEIQDMTGIQVQALTRCCKNYNICFFGDRNQVIVPSTFDFGELEKGIYGKLNGKSTIQRVLKKTYRCGEQLISYLNSLNALRREKIGAGSQEDDALEESMRGDADSSMIAVMVTDPAVCQKFIDEAKETAQCSIIVDNRNTRDGLANGKYAPNIVTVEEAKGLEYNIVVLFNFVRDNYQRFQEIFDGSGVAKKSTLHRMVFNKYYVSCTRAIDRIVICENSEYADKFRDNLFNGLDEKNNLGELLSYLNPSTEAWLTEGIRLYGLGMYQQASDYLRKYISLNPAEISDDYDKYKDLCDCQLLLLQSKRSDDWRHCAETFELYGDFPSARYVYESYLTDKYKTFIVDIKTGRQDYYVSSPDITKDLISSAQIIDEDVNVILKSQLIKNQVHSLINNVNSILEELENGK